MAWHVWLDEWNRQLEYRAGITRLQVAIADVGLITDVAISPAALPSPGARPRICDVVLDPTLAVRGDGRRVGWEWLADSGQSYTITYKLDGATQTINVPALPESPSGIGASEQTSAPIHTGAYVEYRVLRLAGTYPSGGFQLADWDRDTALASAHCDDYLCGIAGGKLRLYSLATMQEISDGTNVSTEVRLTIIRSRL